MLKTFSVKEGNILIASRAWSDFAATLPLIRSFSLGSNFPPQYPIFAGPPIRYHFIFFTIVGLLEKIGVRIDWALNTLSVISFFLLCSAIYYLGKIIFKSGKVGFLSVILFLFNGSFGFLEFFKKNPLSVNTPITILQNTEFSSFGPYDGKIVSAFWSLNIFTNQRHLALAYAAFLFLVLLVYLFSKYPHELTWKKTVAIGLVLGLFPFIHLAAFAMMGIAILTFFLIYPEFRTKLFVLGLIALALAIPQYLYMGSSSTETQLLNPGYLVKNRTLQGYLIYWFMNLGITIILAFIGLILANKSQRKIFLPFLALFIAGNLFQFSPEAAANHKFFNLFAIGVNFFTAFFLVKVWNKQALEKIIAILLLLPLTLTGIIDFFPVVNDRYIELSDYPTNPTIRFIVQNTPKDSVFLNSQFLYDSASLAGRKIFMGWPYFPWATGYNTNARFRIMKTILEGSDKETTCRRLLREHIDYVETQEPTSFEDITTNYLLFEENFDNVFTNKQAKINIYNIKTSCSKLDLKTPY